MYNSKLYCLVLAWTITGFAFFLGNAIGVTTYAIGLKICAITAGIKKYTSKKKKKEKEKKHYEKVLLIQSKLKS